jgi:putative holliday junction resolvase
MRILGIDYGKRKIGLAFADTFLAEPHSVVRYKDHDDAIQKIIDVIRIEEVDQIVIGLPSGVVKKSAEDFGEILQIKTKLPVIFQDEILTTQDAVKMSIEAGIKRKKRKRMEDAYAAALILQQYLDSK